MPKSSPSPHQLAQIIAKRRWSAPDAAKVIEAWRTSNTSRQTFCERHDLDEQRLARWAKSFPTTPAPEFAELVLVGQLPSSDKPALVIELGQARVLVEPDIDDELLARVLRIVGSTC
jgi:hypothetical protein